MSCLSGEANAVKSHVKNTHSTQTYETGRILVALAHFPVDFRGTEKSRFHGFFRGNLDGYKLLQQVAKLAKKRRGSTAEKKKLGLRKY